MRMLLVLSLMANLLIAQNDESPFNNLSPTYGELVREYELLDSASKNTLLLQMGSTDSGKGLLLFLLGKNLPDSADLESFLQGKLVILINNGIHPGEPCGMEASLMLLKKYIESDLPENILLAVIPVYNIGGMLNRNCCSRSNQDGPELYGFRGNARNLDLNRDFIKADARNTTSFYRLFHFLKPHIFIDTHTSNGADYQYDMTLITTQKDKLNTLLANFLTTEMEPALYQAMKQAGHPMIPYVNVFGSTPDKGYAAFLETPRYASGYTALFNTLGFITEAHMLKPYPQRVKATYEFLRICLEFSSKNAEKIISLQKQAYDADRNQRLWSLNWVIDSTETRQLEFRGYDYHYPLSRVSGKPRLKYDNSRPKTYQVEYYDTYKPIARARLPKYYVVPAAWPKVPELLRLNNIEMSPLGVDTAMAVESYYIRDYKFSGSPYEGHFPLQSFTVDTVRQIRNFLKGDLMIPANQRNVRFLMAVLEPEAADSYLRWNFYDEIFQQKEWFSPYVFEDKAEELLRNDESLRHKFRDWKSRNPAMEDDAFQNLYFIYRNSKGYEKEHLRYPIAVIP